LSKYRALRPSLCPAFRVRRGKRPTDRSIARELSRVAGEIAALDEERRRIIGQYAAEQMAGEAYISANRALDRGLERLTREKAKLAAALRSPQQEDFVDAGIRQFCASANARLQACADFDAKREFLVGHVERVIYNRYNVTILGSVPVQSASGETKLPFRIEGKIDIQVVRSEACRRAALETMRALASDAPTAAVQPRSRDWPRLTGLNASQQANLASR
jgi:hypothetical protein